VHALLLPVIASDDASVLLVVGCFLRELDLSDLLDLLDLLDQQRLYRPGCKAVGVPGAFHY
jgi:hypothetical protein